jgi:uncharacterized membrane protein YqgA involved in biofilm formation
LTGTLINSATIILGTILGLLFGTKLPERARESVLSVLGVFTLAIGINLFMQGTSFEGENVLLPLVSLLIGALLGEWWRVEHRLERIGAVLEQRFARGDRGDEQGTRFIRGFVSASLLFCVGPMTILGSIQDGLTGNYELLAIKAVLDGFASLALASSFGIGVLFSVLVVLLYQGGLSLAAAQLQSLFSPLMVAEISVVGGVLLLSLAISTLLRLKPIRTANLLPAILIVPLLVLIVEQMGF